MSAFAAFNLSSKNSSEVSLFNTAFSNFTASSNVKLGRHNAIFTNTSILIGLNKDEYIIAFGTYTLSVLKGSLLVNNLYEINPGRSYPVITNSNQSLPVLCGTEKTNTQSDSILPKYSTVVKLDNLRTGLQDIGHILPHVSDLYCRQPSSQYTFEVLENPRENVVGLRIDQTAHRAIVNVSNELASTQVKAAIVAGTSFSGKSTIAKLLMDYMLINKVPQVVLMDLDPNSTKFSLPGCLSLTIHSEPAIGNLITSSRIDDEVCYFGFSSPSASPSHYLRCVEHLKNVSIEQWDKVPLVINTPPGIKGLARKVLIKITHIFRDLDPALIYLTQNDAIEVGEFEVEEFETQDNPDEEVIADLEYHSLHQVQATRRKPKYSGSAAHELSIASYFHRVPTLQWDFSKFLVETAPVIIPFADEPESVPIVASLHETLHDLRPESLQEYIEASVVALCSIDIPKRTLQGRRYPHFLNTNQYLQYSSRFICLCMVHSINTKEGHYLAYMPSDAVVTKRLQNIASSSETLAFVKGEGAIPSGELLAPQFLKKTIPYVTSAPRSKVGGVWNARKNLGRKGQK